MRRLSDRVAIVTGAAQGLGAVFAKALAAEDARVAVCDVDAPDATCAAIREAGGAAFGRIADVTDPKAVAALVEATMREFGRIDILVNNAALSGKIPMRPLSEIDSAEWDRVMAVNTRGVFECVKAVLPHMRARKHGKIINIASGTAFKGIPYLLHYVASKGAVLAMTRALARELGNDGIRVNCISPGLTLSENVRSNPSYAGEAMASNIASRALRRAEVPEDLIGALIFLASPDSDFITGQTLPVDGGSVMH